MFYNSHEASFLFGGLFSRYHYTEFGEVPHFYLILALDIKGIRIMKLTQLDNKLAFYRNVQIF
ncbi:hypothetical protein ADM90_10430 [Lysinibacillus macroides]|uniref:Uncharacterized protein n=1 Tax=Lysinibacillus macroides TaxID=33935 RepID=A0A0M9DID7_9BACI|nr:hypothetical protein ADM90_10430 [Lysinibacillus macroides]